MLDILFSSLAAIAIAVCFMVVVETAARAAIAAVQKLQRRTLENRVYRAAKALPALKAYNVTDAILMNNIRGMPDCELENVWLQLK